MRLKINYKGSNFPLLERLYKNCYYHTKIFIQKEKILFNQIMNKNIYKNWTEKELKRELTREREMIEMEKRLTISTPNGRENK